MQINFKQWTVNILPTCRKCMRPGPIRQHQTQASQEDAKTQAPQTSEKE